MKRSLIAIAVSLLTLTSCADYLTPDGEITEREIEIPTAAEGIEITDGMRLVLDETIPAGTAIIRTHGNIQSYIKAETNRNRTIFTVDARRFKNLDVTITISPASYNTFTASGGSEIYSPEMQDLAKASFIISGGSHAKISATCDTASIEWRFRSKGPQKTDDYFGVKPPKKDPIINKKGRELGSRASIFRSIATQLS